MQPHTRCSAALHPVLLVRPTPASMDITNTKANCGPNSRRLPARHRSRRCLAPNSATDTINAGPVYLGKAGDRHFQLHHGRCSLPFPSGNASKNFRKPRLIEMGLRTEEPAVLTRVAWSNG